jgi:hypothetical protein
VVSEVYIFLSMMAFRHITHDLALWKAGKHIHDVKDMQSDTSIIRYLLFRLNISVGDTFIQAGSMHQIDLRHLALLVLRSYSWRPGIKKPLDSSRSTS